MAKINKMDYVNGLGKNFQEFSLAVTYTYHISYSFYFYIFTQEKLKHVSILRSIQYCYSSFTVIVKDWKHSEFYEQLNG